MTALRKVKCAFCNKLIGLNDKQYVKHRLPGDKEHTVCPGSHKSFSAKYKKVRINAIIIGKQRIDYVAFFSQNNRSLYELAKRDLAKRYPNDIQKICDISIQEVK